MGLGITIERLWVCAAESMVSSRVALLFGTMWTVSTEGDDAMHIRFRLYGHDLCPASRSIIRREAVGAGVFSTGFR